MRVVVSYRAIIKLNYFITELQLLELTPTRSLFYSFDNNVLKFVILTHLAIVLNFSLIHAREASYMGHMGVEQYSFGCFLHL